MPLRGQMPPPGYGQSLCVYKHRLILFGGTCGSFFYNHLFEYDTQEQVGREGGEGGREGGAMLLSVCPLSCAAAHHPPLPPFLFLQVWTRLQAQGRPPNPRYKHQAVVVGDSMYILGGGQYSPEEGPMDIHKLNLETMVPYALAPLPSLPPSFFWLPSPATVCDGCFPSLPPPLPPSLPSSLHHFLLVLIDRPQ